MRLRDLGVDIGVKPVGMRNGITDVKGISVGHCAIAESGLVSGVTVVWPYPAGVEKRMLFVGKWSAIFGDDMTGLGVAEDFGTFSSPIALVPSAAVGRAYDGLIQHGIGRDPGLSTSTGWPPVVIGVNDSVLNPPATSFAVFREDHLEQAMKNLEVDEVSEGSVGVGRGLCAFGLRGGVGTSSRVLQSDEQEFTVGAFTAANGGEAGDLCIDRYPIDTNRRDVFEQRPRSFVALIATDAPLIPLQCRQLALRAISGLYRVGLISARTDEGIAIAFSTFPVEQDGAHQLVGRVSDDLLVELSVAAEECCEEAVLNGLLAAKPLTANGVRLESLEADTWTQTVNRFKRGAQ